MNDDSKVYDSSAYDSNQLPPQHTRQVRRKMYMFYLLTAVLIRVNASERIVIESLPFFTPMETSDLG
jgi:hypothetical protein